jgi:hypothetical protein
MNTIKFKAGIILMLKPSFSSVCSIELIKRNKCWISACLKSRSHRQLNMLSLK